MNLQNRRVLAYQLPRILPRCHPGPPLPRKENPLPRPLPTTPHQPFQDQTLAPPVHIPGYATATVDLKLGIDYIIDLFMACSSRS